MTSPDLFTAEGGGRRDLLFVPRTGLDVYRVRRQTGSGWTPTKDLGRHSASDVLDQVKNVGETLRPRFRLPTPCGRSPQRLSTARPLLLRESLIFEINLVCTFHESCHGPDLVQEVGIGDSSNGTMWKSRGSTLSKRTSVSLVPRVRTVLVYQVLIIYFGPEVHGLWEHSQERGQSIRSLSLESQFRGLETYVSSPLQVSS